MLKRIPGLIVSGRSLWYHVGMGISLVSVVRDLLNILYPPRCAGCQRPMDGDDGCGVCSFCRQNIKRNPLPYCVACGRGVERAGTSCRECLRMKPCFDRAYASCLYEGVLKELIHRFKYNNAKPLAAFLTGLMAEFVDQNPDVASGIDVITFVPLSARRLGLRGFNQSGLLAQGLARVAALPCEGLLEKRKATRNQNELSREERLKNMAGAFSAARRSRNVSGKAVLVIDDVMTTGSTFNECARALKGSGAREVRCLALARGPAPS